MNSNVSVRPMTAADREEVLAMMRVFYDSEAVFHTSSDAVLSRDVDDCIGACPFLEGFILCCDGKTAGYAMTALSYTTEYGGICVWLEDLYIQPQFRGKGIGSVMLRFLEERYPDAVRFKLEVEPENASAVACYQKSGFRISPYHLMTKETDPDD